MILPLPQRARFWRKCGLPHALAHALAAVLGTACTLGASPGLAQPTEPAQADASAVVVIKPGVIAPAKLTPAIDLADVRIGMKGYGMSVFAGDRIEPFPVVVQAVVPDATPGRAVVWVRCTSERMLRHGPVQGMSGSPIYLWREGEAETLGRGGRLLGAFAFGYGDTNECVVGVQPIAYMRETRSRIPDGPVGARSAGAAQPSAIEVDPTLALRMAQGYVEASDTWGRPARFPAVAARALLERWTRPGAGRTPERAQNRANASGAWQGLADVERFWSDATRSSSTSGARGEARWSSAALTPLALPLTVNSPHTAAFLDPVFAPTGLRPVSGGGLVSGTPAPSINPDTPISAGSVLAVPLVIGDLDLGAIGTATEVLPDGSVLGFGHSLFGRGDVVMPMASGYVHFVVSRINTSFKLAGSLRVVGVLERDEQFGIVGRPTADPDLPYAPVTVEVDLPDREVQTFEFQVFADPLLGPGLLAAAVSESLNAVLEPGPLHTVAVQADMTFEGGHKLSVSSEVASAGPGTAVGAFAPFAQVLSFNPIEPAPLTGAKVKLTVREDLESVQVMGGRLSQGEARPGETVTVSIDLKPADGPLHTVHAQVEIPEDAEPGLYPVVVADPVSYATLRLASDPSLGQVTSLEDIVRQLNAIGQMDARRLHVVTQRSDLESLAVAGHLLPKLPASKAALLADAPRTDVESALVLESQSLPVDGVVQGSFSLLIVIPDPEEEAE
ncbi:MAG: hypothetical protein AAF288_07440 [Planctomycetota bacterium]